MSTGAPPGPFGNGHGALNAQFFQRDIYGFLSQLASVFGDIVRFDLGRKSCVLVNNAEHVQTLFVQHESDMVKPDFLSGSNRGHWGDGLTTLEGAAWQARRPVLRPSFQPQALDARLETTRRCVLELIARWQDQGCIDLARDLRILTARLAFRSVLGADIDGEELPADETDLVPMAEAFGEDFMAQATGYDIPGFAMTRPRAPADMSRTVALIDARWSDPDAVDCIASDLVRVWRKDPALSREDLIGEVVQMLFAGHLTMPLSLLACWRVLDAAPDIAKALVEEAAEFDLHGDGLQSRLLRSYAMRVLKEAMRLDPPAPVLYRDVARAFALGGFALEKGQTIWVAPRLLHHDARYFPNPDRVNPERFQGGLPGSSRGAYLPFGAGPRICVAQNAAQLQMALILLIVAQSGSLQPGTYSDGKSRFWAGVRTPDANEDDQIHILSLPSRE